MKSNVYLNFIFVLDNFFFFVDLNNGKLNMNIKKLRDAFEEPYFLNFKIRIQNRLYFNLYLQNELISALFIIFVLLKMVKMKRER